MITVNASRREPICLRHQGENDAMRVAFPLSAFEADWPGGTPLLLVQRPRSSRDAEAYPVALSVDGHTAYWTVSASDIEYSGYGKAQLQWRVEDVLVKSCIYDTVCVPSLHAGAEPPDEPSKRWFDAIQAQIGNLADLTTEEKKNLVAAINEAARSGGGGGGGVQADWSQNDAQAADFVKNRPGAYMSDPVATEIYNGILPESANIQMDYVPTLGDVVTVKVGAESIDCTVGDFDGFPYFATVPIEDIAGGTATNYVFCAYRAPQWFAQTGGTYTGQNAVIEGTIRQVVKIPEKFLELENVKDVYWITFEFDQKTQTYFSKKIDGTYAEYADIKAAIDNGKLVAAVASVFGESNNVGLVDGYGKYVNGMSVSFYEVRKGSNTLMGLASFRWKSGHIWEKIDGSIEFSYAETKPSTLTGKQGDSDSVARSDHSHPDRTSIQFLGKLIDGDAKTVACGNVSPDTPFVVSGLDIPIGAEITLGFDDYTPDTPVTMVWGGTATVDFSNSGNFWRVNLAYNACTDAYTLTTTRALTNLTLTYKNAPAQTKDYQKYVLAPYTVAPHLLLASPNGLHKLTVDDNGTVLVDGRSVDGTVTEADIENALGYKPIGAADVPVKSVNGATGATKSTFYVTVAPTGSGYVATADKTAAEVYAAYAAGYAVYAIVTFDALEVPLELPLVSAVNMSGVILLGFAALGSMAPNSAPMYPTITYNGTVGKWYAWLGTLARASDIPTIPTELKNPYSLNIKIGDTTTSYDGSAAKTVEIPEGVPAVTDADNGKILRVVNGAWVAAELLSAGGVSF